ncbi:hypothetical protein E4U41_003849 [Claviceps citrina]|nr:hypothetical protein E4U41_003849 [Claviceps citrina]
MAGHGDIQELLRMLTSRKVPMMTAMGHLKALQSQKLRSIEQIAEAPLSTLESAIPDARLAKSLQAACRSHGKGTPKRAAEADDEAAGAPGAKKPRLLQTHTRDLDYGAMSANELEAALELPLEQDVDVIRQTIVVTNRAPLVLAFAVELLRLTMPEQPPSSRLSLAQAVVSANSRSKAISIGIEKAPAAAEAQIPDGQPKVRVLGREVAVLKRGGYTWGPAADEATESTPAATSVSTWTSSQKLTSRGSAFVAHAASLSSPSMRSGLMKALMSDKPDLETATHNAWALRSSYGNSPLVQEASFDDGESGCGKFLLGIMREAGVQNTLVVLTRWYGGVMLGPDRWRLMRNCLDDALSSRRRTCTLTGEAVWGLDPENKTRSPAMTTTTTTTSVGMPIHRPEGARNYLLRSFATAPSEGEGAASTEKKRNTKTKTLAALSDEKQANLGRLLGALRLLFESWAGFLPRDELDRRAWGWYLAVRPDVDAGPSGWGAKGQLRLSSILDLRRREGVSGGQDGGEGGVTEGAA